MIENGLIEPAPARILTGMNRRGMWMEVRIGLLRGLGFSCACAGFIGTVLFAQSMTSFQAGDLVSASTLNANFTALQTKVTEASPDGGVVAFNLTECPTGWLAADGANGTRDLRGVFVRGLNDFNSAEGTRIDGRQDPDGLRTLGDFQDDQNASHTHNFNQTIYNNGHTSGWSSSGPTLTPVWTGGTATYAAASGGNESRPTNIGLIFCQRAS